MISGIIHIIVHLRRIVQCAVEFEGRRRGQKKGSRLSDDRAGGGRQTQKGKKPTGKGTKLTGFHGKWEILLLPHFQFPRIGYRTFFNNLS
jgi:hypothetical protein